LDHDQDVSIYMYVGMRIGAGIFDILNGTYSLRVLENHIYIYIYIYISYLYMIT